MNVTIISPFEDKATVASTRIVDFAKEHYSECLIAEMLPLWRSHHDEVAFYKDMVLSPDLKLYEASDKLGLLRIFTARYEGILIGYEIFFVHEHPHYSTIKQAVQDLLFMSKTMRSGMLGYRFIKWSDEQLASEDVSVIFQHVENTYDYSSLLRRMGYVEHERKFSRRIK